ncbi:MAG: peptide ABC transporter substrate-binding protein [Candidatus Magasanikbacteria bacterium]|nr:peptide ABC transporter substrate-binding protein [Candidatus Magasanikbacteria bacterium]
MDWHKIFKPFFKREPKPLVRDFDKKLVKNLRHRFWPSRAQLRYLGRFLSKREKTIIGLSCFFILAVFIAWFIIILPKHREILPKSGGEYIEALVGQPKLINPVFASANDVDADISPLLYARLFKIGEGQKLISELASSLSISDDQKIYSIKLREDAFWTDDEKITADDVLFTFETIQNPETNSPLYPAFNGVTVEKINEYEVRLTLKEAYTPFAGSLAVGIIPEHIFGQIPPASLRLANENLQPQAVSGPWKFSKMIKNETNIETLTLERNDRFFGELPYLKKLSFKFYQDVAEAADDLHAKAIMGLAFLPRNLSEKLAGKNFSSYDLHLPQYTALFFNQSSQPFLKNADLKQALAKAIDKKTVLQSALGDQGETIEAPILPGFVGFNADIKKIEYNVDEANALLDKEWPRLTPEEYFALKRDEMIKERIDAVKNNDDFKANSSTITADVTKEAEETIRSSMRPDQAFYRKNKQNAVLSLTITTADTPEYQNAAETLALMWRAIGVQTGVLVVQGRQIGRDVLKGREYEILLYGEIVGDDPDPYPFWHSSQTEYPGLNLAMYSDRQADKLLEDARFATSTETREKIYREFQDTLLKAMPAIFLYTPSYEYLIDNEVRGVDIGRIYSPADRFNNLNKWYIKTRWGWKK